MALPSEMPKRLARVEPTASSTARTSSMRCSRVGSWSVGTRSESPVPRLSKVISRPTRPSREKKRTNSGCSQCNSMLETKPGMNSRSSCPSPTTW